MHPSQTKLLLHERLPFKWRNPVGFLIAIVMEYAILLYALIVTASILSMAIASFLYAVALSRDIKGSLFAFNLNAQAKVDQPILLDQLTEFIEVHSSAKQLSKNYSNL